MKMSQTPKPKPTPNPLMAALALANKSGDATGKLPPSTCKQTNATIVTCTAPAAGISGVVFQTYPNQKALYAAYTAKVTALNTAKFRQNFNDCGSQDTFGEVGWNHLFKHTRSFTVNQMIMGTVRDDQAAGRVFCNYAQGLEYMVWTQNDGHLMGYVAGPVHTDVWDWWVAVHHNIGIGGSPMNMNMPTPSTSGNGASPSMSPSPSMSGMSASPSPSTTMTGMRPHVITPCPSLSAQQLVPWQVTLAPVLRPRDVVAGLTPDPWPLSPGRGRMPCCPPAGALASPVTGRCPANHHDVTSSWSRPRQCGIVVVDPGGRGGLARES
jgi:hypothetical protein